MYSYMVVICCIRVSVPLVPSAGTEGTSGTVKSKEDDMTDSLRSSRSKSISDNIRMVDITKSKLEFSLSCNRTGIGISIKADILLGFYERWRNPKVHAALTLHIRCVNIASF